MKLSDKNVLDIVIAINCFLSLLFGGLAAYDYSASKNSQSVNVEVIDVVK